MQMTASNHLNSLNIKFKLPQEFADAKKNKESRSADAERILIREAVSTTAT